MVGGERIGLDKYDKETFGLGIMLSVKIFEGLSLTFLGLLNKIE